jgi:hypothetical protein
MWTEKLCKKFYDVLHCIAGSSNVFVSSIRISRNKVIWITTLFCELLRLQKSGIAQTIELAAPSSTAEQTKTDRNNCQSILAS